MTRPISFEALEPEPDPEPPALVLPLVPAPPGWTQWVTQSQQTAVVQPSYWVHPEFTCAATNSTAGLPGYWASTTAGTTAVMVTLGPTITLPSMICSEDA